MTSKKMKSQKEKIFDAFKKYEKYSETEVSKLEKKYNLERIDEDEVCTTFKFKDTGITFDVPYDEDYYEDDWDLSGVEKEIADKFVKIVADCWEKLQGELQDDGIELDDVDGACSWWYGKDTKRYWVVGIPESVEDIEMENF